MGSEGYLNYTKHEIELAVTANEKIEEGKEKEKLNIAKNMIDLGIDTNTIEKATGLSALELKRLTK